MKNNFSPGMNITFSQKKKKKRVKIRKSISIDTDMSYQYTLNSVLKKGKNNKALVERLINLRKGKRLTKLSSILPSHQFRLYHSYNNNNFYEKYV